MRDAAGPQVEVVDVERGDRERLAVVLHRQGGDVWAAGPVIQVVANADGGGAEQQQPHPQILQPGGGDNVVEEGDDQGGDRGEPGDEVILLAPFELAVLPPENMGAGIEDGDGWMMIDSLSAEACILSLSSPWRKSPSSMRQVGERPGRLSFKDGRIQFQSWRKRGH